MAVMAPRTEYDAELRAAIAHARFGLRNGFWSPSMETLRLLADAAERSLLSNGGPVGCSMADAAPVGGLRESGPA